MTDSSKHSDSSQPVNNHADNLAQFIRNLEGELGSGGGATLDELYDLALAVRVDFGNLVAGIEHNTPGQEAKNNQASLPMSEALIQAEIRGAIDAISQYETKLTDQGTDNYLQIAHDLIADLEKKR